MKKWQIATLSFVFVLVDLLSKWWALDRLPIVFNEGIAFGIEIPMFLIVVMNIALIPLVIWVFFSTFDFGYLLSGVVLALITGGALGNLIDRLWDGSVVDFIDVGFWPSFNLADSFVVAGVLLAVTFYDKIKRNNTYG